MTHRTFDPAILDWIARLAEASAELSDLRSPDLPARRVAQRQLSDLMATEVTLPGPDSIHVQTFEVRPGLTARRYRDSHADPDEPLPTQLFLHGGGFSGGSAFESVNDRMLRARAAATGMQFFSLEYRLAPEHPYPAAVDDAILAFPWMLQQRGVDPARSAMGGVSAGAGVIASAILRMRNAGSPLPRHLLLEVPPVSVTPLGASARNFAVGFGLEGLDELLQLYIGEATIDQYLSPLEVDDLSGLPRTLIMTAEFDPLRDAGEAFAARLEAAGVPISLERGIGHLHGTMTLTRTLAIARDWQSIIDIELREHVVASEKVS